MGFSLIKILDQLTRNIQTQRFVNQIEKENYAH